MCLISFSRVYICMYECLCIMRLYLCLSVNSNECLCVCVCVYECKCKCVTLINVKVVYVCVCVCRCVERVFHSRRVYYSVCSSFIVLSRSIVPRLLNYKDDGILQDDFCPLAVSSWIRKRRSFRDPRGSVWISIVILIINQLKRRGINWPCIPFSVVSLLSFDCWLYFVDRVLA